MPLRISVRRMRNEENCWELSAREGRWQILHRHARAPHSPVTLCTESRVLFMVWNRIWALCFCFETFKCVTHTRLKLLFVVISRFIEMGKKCTRSISDTWCKGQRSIDLKCDYAYLEKTFPPLSISQHYCVAYCILTLWYMNMMNISRAYLSKMNIHLHINEFKQNKLFVSIKTTYESPEWETLTRKIQK